MSELSGPLRAWCINVGMIAARKVFRDRGDHSEVHLSLAQLQAICQYTAEATAEHVLRAIERGAKEVPT